MELDGDIWKECIIECNFHFRNHMLLNKKVINDKIDIKFLQLELNQKKQSQK